MSYNIFPYLAIVLSRPSRKRHRECNSILPVVRQLLGILGRCGSLTCLVSSHLSPPLPPSPTQPRSAIPQSGPSGVFLLAAHHPSRQDSSPSCDFHLQSPYPTCLACPAGGSHSHHTQQSATALVPVRQPAHDHRDHCRSFSAGSSSAFSHSWQRSASRSQSNFSPT